MRLQRRGPPDGVQHVPDGVSGAASDGGNFGNQGVGRALFQAHGGRGLWRAAAAPRPACGGADVQKAGPPGEPVLHPGGGPVLGGAPRLGGGPADWSGQGREAAAV